ncbi:MAG: WD40 repeat domain-containing protein [Cyanobacteria bacterium J06632_22]
MTARARGRRPGKRSTVSGVNYRQHWQGQVEGYITALTWSPDGQYLAVSTGSGQVAVWTETGLMALPLASDLSVSCLAFSADNAYLAAAGQQGVVTIWRVGEWSQPVVELAGAHDWIDRLQWHPQQPLLAYGAQQQVRFWGDAAPAPLDFGDSSVLDLAWRPQGSGLAVSGHTGVKVWSCQDWTAVPENIEVPGASMAVAWSADGRYLASGNLDRTLTVVAWGQPPPWLMQGFPGKVRRVDWVGQRLVAACTDGITVWRRQGADWQSQVLQGHRHTVVAIAPHPTQALLASAAQDGRLCLWENAAKLRQTLVGSAPFSTLSWHPQGTALAAGDQQGMLTIWRSPLRGQGFQMS